ncbi:unnamed protein product [Stenotrophomonas maltophilia]|nr:unnamed protein product [Stenotrophomonas maltophilia]
MVSLMHNGAYLVAARIADTDQEPSIAITSHHSQLSATRTCVEHRLKPKWVNRAKRRGTRVPLGGDAAGQAYGIRLRIASGRSVVFPLVVPAEVVSAAITGGAAGIGSIQRGRNPRLCGDYSWRPQERSP